MSLVTNYKNSLILKEKRIWNTYYLQEAPQSAMQKQIYKGVKSGSLTVEAALVFPLFLFAIVGIMAFFRILQFQQMTAGALAVAGSKLSLAADENTDSTALAIVEFWHALPEDLPISWLIGGHAGIGWSGSSLEGEYVDLQINYLCKLPIQIFGIKSIPVSQRVYMKKWTGYHGISGEDTTDRWVYITPNGSVYHDSLECTHLRLSIHAVDKRSVLGGRYSPCELCGRQRGTATCYYVTDEGNRYHTRLSCSGLKRTVYMVKISQVGDKKPCSRCRGG